MGAPGGRWNPTLSRRQLLRGGARGAGALGVSLFGASVAAPLARAAGGGADSFGSLLPRDPNGLMLPPGFSSRVVAVSNQRVAATGYRWHGAPDGGASFAAPGGGWVYVSNSELSGTNGGASAIRFDATGAITDAYSILTGTQRNCAGGPTPWGTWLSCEEVDFGEIYECDPFAPGSQGTARPAMGIFNHEAAAVDPVAKTVYLTEDRPDGLLYRFTPSAYPNLSAGVLEAAAVLDPTEQGPITPGQVRPLTWHVVPDPTLQGFFHTRHQVAAATKFDGGEGCWYDAGRVFFTTKWDNRVWRLDTNAQTLEILYDLATSQEPELSNVDNVTVTACGDVLVAEDPGDLQIVALTPSGDVKPIVRLTGASGTEITGPAVSPDGMRLYFSSQRNPGITYEVTGPFAPPAPHVPLGGGFGSALLAASITAFGALSLRSTNRTDRPRV